MANSETARLAVLIDADNASASVVKELLEEVAKYGTATVKRAYGDWTTTNLVGWKEHLHRHAIQPMQQFAYTKGKNSTDSAFIIDAMDLLYAGNLDGFCLVSSDSDFTRLATRMREAGKLVYGFGERKTPEPFIAACDKFIFLEVLKRPAEAAAPMAVSIPSRLEAAYLATGQARRAEAIRQAMASWRRFRPSPYDPSKGIQLGALVCLVDSDDKQHLLFLGPDGGSMKLVSGAQLVQVISFEAPLGRAVLGKHEGDEVSIEGAPIRHQFEVLRVH